MVVIPLVFSSIVLGLSSSPDPEFLRKAALRIFPYFVATTAIAVAIGISLALFFKPGRYIDSGMVSRLMQGTQFARVHVESDQLHIADRIVALIPSNYVRAALEQDMLATVILAIIIGLALTAAKADTKGVLLNLFQAVQEVSMTIVGWAMKLAPVAVFALICTITMRIGFGAIFGMAAYIGTVLLGLVVLLIFYLADTLTDLRQMVKDAVQCNFHGTE
jgi:Na+/H+-dicarboxylate symporter